MGRGSFGGEFKASHCNQWSFGTRLFSNYFEDLFILERGAADTHRDKVTDVTDHRAAVGVGDGKISEVQVSCFNTLSVGAVKGEVVPDDGRPYVHSRC